MKNRIIWSGRAHNYTAKEIQYIVRAIKEADPLTQGKYLSIFEDSLRKYLKKKNVFAVSSAASALEIIAQLLQIKKNEEIIIPAHTYCASAIPFARNGAKIIWGDINFNTRTLDPEDVKKKITKNTKAIVLVHLYGYAADPLIFKKIIGNNKIFLIEDCAQAFGSQIHDRKVGTMGDFSCFSFHGQKNLTTLGEGGALYVKNSKDALKVKGLRHNGHSNYNKNRKFYWKPAMGNLTEDLKNSWPNKFTLSEPQCAAGSVVLKRLDTMNLLRISRAKYFINSINKITDKLIFNSDFSKRHVYHLLTAYVVPSRDFNRDILIKNLHFKYGIKCIVQYYPLYKYPLFKNKGFGRATCPQTEKFYNNMISFPFHIWMKNSDVKYMINSLKEVICA